MRPDSWRICVIALCFALVFTSCGQATDTTTPVLTTPELTELGSVAAAQLTPNATVLSVTDGDTVVLDIDGIEEPVRLIGIDTPEKSGGLRPAECYGDEASQHVRELLPVGTEVYLERDVEARDRYDRLLGYLYRANDSLFINASLVEDGYAAAYRFEPNIHHSELFEAAQRSARSRELGLWGACGGPDRVIG